MSTTKPTPPSGAKPKPKRLLAGLMRKKTRLLINSATRLAKGTGRCMGESWGTEQFYQADQMQDATSKNRVLDEHEVAQCRSALRIPPSDRTPADLSVAVLSWIQNLPIFKKLQSKFINQLDLLRALVLTEYDGDDVVFHEDDEAENFHIIVSGVVDVRVSDRNDRRLTHSVAELKSGETFGELGLLGALGSSRRSATILCKEPSVLLQLPKEYFQNVVRDSHEQTIKHKVKFLTHIDAFRNSDPTKLRRLAYFLKECVFENGQVLVHAGDKIDTIFFLRSGECRMLAMPEGHATRAEHTHTPRHRGGSSNASKPSALTNMPPRIQPGLLAPLSPRTVGCKHIASVCGGGIVGDSAVLVAGNQGAFAKLSVVCSTMVTAYRIKRVDFMKRVDNEALSLLKQMARTKAAWHETRTESMMENQHATVARKTPRSCHQLAASRLISTGSTPRLKERRLETASVLDRAAASARALQYSSPKVKLPLLAPPSKSLAASARSQRHSGRSMHQRRRLQSMTGRGFQGSNPICVRH